MISTDAKFDFTKLPWNSLTALKKRLNLEGCSGISFFNSREVKMPLHTDNNILLDRGFSGKYLSKVQYNVKHGLRTSRHFQGFEIKVSQNSKQFRRKKC